jgi:hypothetical protein
LLGKGDTESLTGALKELAARHVTYGVHPYHYAPVGLCILYAFSKTVAEEEWNNEAQDAWITVYSLICQVMIPVAVEGWWTSAKVKDGQVLEGESGRDFAAVKSSRSSGSNNVTVADAVGKDEAAAASCAAASSAGTMAAAADGSPTADADGSPTADADGSPTADADGSPTADGSPSAVAVSDAGAAPADTATADADDSD